MEAIDSHGATALTVAAAAGNLRLVRKLLERGAKVSLHVLEHWSAVCPP